MKVLYIDGVGPFGGASRSLYEVVRAMPEGEVEAYFVAVRGTVIPFYSKLATGIIAAPGLTRFDNTLYSHYRGIRWLILLRELAHVPSTIVAIWRAKSRWKNVDVIHANEVTEIFPLLLAKWFFKAPVVVHVRSLTMADERSWRSRWLRQCLREKVEAVVAIDHNVRSTLPEDVAVDVIHNSFTAQRNATPDQELLNNLSKLRPESLKVGFVGNLHHSKGLFDLVEAARIVKASGRDVEFVIVGGATRPQRGLKNWLLKRIGLAQDVGAAFARQVEEYGLTDAFHLLGHTTDIQCAYEQMDVLCFPSHFDAPGRPVFEAAFSAVPSIVAVTQPHPDTMVHGETGLAIPGRQPAKLADAIGYFADNRSESVRMGRNARQLAEANFEPRANAGRLYEVYSRVVRRSSNSHGGTMPGERNV